MKNSSKKKKPTKRSVIRKWCEENGNHHSPSYMIEMIDHDCDREVNHADIVRTIGSYVNRLRGSDKDISQEARRFLRNCSQDITFAKHVLTKEFSRARV
jgi:hypothetical protein